MPTLLALLLGIAIVLLVVKLRGMPRRGRTRFKCHGCRHLRRTFDDGVMCGYGAREVFKTRAHISMCPDWAPQLERRR